MTYQNVSAPRGTVSFEEEFKRSMNDLQYRKALNLYGTFGEEYQDKFKYTIAAAIASDKIDLTLANLESLLKDVLTPGLEFCSNFILSWEQFHQTNKD